MSRYDFIPPPFARPNDYGELEQTIPRSLDQLFNAYIGIQQQKRAADIDRRQELLSRAQLAGEGLNPTQYDPNNPGGFFEPLIKRRMEERALAGRKLQAETREAEAAARLKNTMARQGGSGGMAAEEANRLLGVELFPVGGFVTKQQLQLANNLLASQKLPEATKGQLMAIRDSKAFLEELMSSYRKLVSSGKTGFFAGGLSEFKARASKGNLEPDVFAYLKAREGLTGRLKAVAGEVGRITDQDVMRMIGLIASPSTGPEAAERTFDQVTTILERGERNILEQYPLAIRRLGTKIGGAKPQPAASRSEKDDPLGLFQ